MLIPILNYLNNEEKLVTFVLSYLVIADNVFISWAATVWAGDNRKCLYSKVAPGSLGLEIVLLDDLLMRVENSRHCLLKD